MRLRRREDNLYRVDLLRIGLFGALLAVNYWLFLAPSDSPVPSIEARLRVLHEVAAEASPEPAEPTAEADPGAVAGVFSRGDTITSVLKHAGASPADVKRYVSALGTVLDFRSLKVGDRFQVRFESGALASVEVATSPLDVFVARLPDEVPEGLDTSLEVMKKKVDAVRKVARLGCVITDSLYASLARCGGDDKLAWRVIDLLGPSIDFYTDLRYGDTLRILAEKLYIGDQFVDYDRILAIEYAGQVRHQVAYNYQSPSGDWEYYDDDAESVARMFLRSPLKFRRVSSGFDPKRMHPILHKEKAHLAVDYAAATGTPVWAYAGGVVTYAAMAGAAGNLVKIKHPNGYVTLYGHLKGFKKALKAGDRVNQGQVIGYVGTTGRSTGPHLHFALHHKGRAINPFKVDNPALHKLPLAHRKHFDEAVHKLREQLKQIPVETQQQVRRTS